MAGASWLLRLLVPTAAQIALVVVALFGRYVVLARVASRTRSAATLVTYVVGSAAYGLVASAATVSLGLSDYYDTGQWVVNATIYLTLSLVVANDLVDSLQEYRVRRDDLLHSIDELRELQVQAEHTIVAERKEAVAGVTRMLEHDIELLSAAEPPASVERLRVAAHDVVRPLSHDLATTLSPLPPIEASPRRRAPLGVRALLESSLDPAAITPITLATLMATLMVPFSLALFPLPYVAVLAPLTFLFGWALTRGAQRAVLHPMRHRPLAVRGLALIVTLAVAGIALAVAVGIIVRNLPFGAAVVALPPFALLLGLTLAFSYAVGRQREATTAELDQANEDLRWEVARANETKWRQQRALARALHGPVQAALNAGAIRLDMAARAGTLTDGLVDDVRESVRAALTDFLGPSEPASDLRSAIDRLDGLWRGVCDVHLDIDAEAEAHLVADPTSGTSVIDIVMEACANAIQHGRARTVSIAIRMVGTRTLSCRVIDDGAPAAATSATGLGTQLLDELCLEWSRTRDGSTMTLHCLLPIQSGR